MILFSIIILLFTITRFVTIFRFILMQCVHYSIFFLVPGINDEQYKRCLYCESCMPGTNKFFRIKTLNQNSIFFR